MSLGANKVSSIDCGLSLAVHLVQRWEGRDKAEESREDCRPSGNHFYPCCWFFKTGI